MMENDKRLEERKKSFKQTNIDTVKELESYSVSLRKAIRNTFISQCRTRFTSSLSFESQEVSVYSVI